MPETLNVFWGDKKVGRLWLTEKREFIFQYDPSWVGAPEALPISLKLPVRPEAFEANQSKPFFSNLLPEQEVRRMIAKKLGVSEGNDFKLLEELGGDCAGALSLLPGDAAPPAGGSFVPLSDEELDRMIDEIPRRPLIAVEGGVFV